jgi:transcription initiation factor TFIIB
LVCSACKSELILTDHECGEVFCGRCGVVIERVVSSIHEWRAFSLEESYRKGRTGRPTSLALTNRGFLTSIGKRDAKGRELGADERIGRIRIWDFRIQSASDRSLKQALPELERLKENLGLPDQIVEKTAYFFRKASRAGLIKGRTVSSILAASAYLACRELETPRSIIEIARCSDVTRKKVSRDYRLLVRTFDPKIPGVDHVRCVTRIANKVGVSEKTKRVAVRLMRDIVRAEISAGKGPMGIAATVLYIACICLGELRTQKDLAAAAGVTEVTIRNRYSELRRYLPSTAYLQQVAKSSTLVVAIVVISINASLLIGSFRLAAVVLH